MAGGQSGRDGTNKTNGGAVVDHVILSGVGGTCRDRLLFLGRASEGGGRWIPNGRRHQSEEGGKKEREREEFFLREGKWLIRGTCYQVSSSINVSFQPKVDRQHPI